MAFLYIIPYEKAEAEAEVAAAYEKAEAAYGEAYDKAWPPALRDRDEARVEAARDKAVAASRRSQVAFLDRREAAARDAALHEANEAYDKAKAARNAARDKARAAAEAALSAAHDKAKAARDKARAVGNAAGNKAYEEAMTPAKLEWERTLSDAYPGPTSDNETVALRLFDKWVEDCRRLLE